MDYSSSTTSVPTTCTELCSRCNKCKTDNCQACEDVAPLKCKCQDQDWLGDERRTADGMMLDIIYAYLESTQRGPEEQCSRREPETEDNFCLCGFCDGRELCGKCGNCTGTCECDSEGEEEREMDPVDVLISQVNEILSVPEGDDADLILEGEALLDELHMLLSSPHPRRFNLANAAVSLNERIDIEWPAWAAHVKCNTGEDCHRRDPTFFAWINQVDILPDPINLRPTKCSTTPGPEEHRTTVAPTMATEPLTPAAGDEFDETRSEGSPVGQTTDLGGHDLDDTHHALSPAKNLERDDEDETAPSEPSASASSSKLATRTSEPKKLSHRAPASEEHGGPEEKENRAPKRSRECDTDDEKGAKRFEKRRRVG